MENKETEREMEASIDIDYDNIDVADIMAQIKARIARRPSLSPESETLDLESVSSLSGGGWKKRVKGLLLLIMGPFMPLVRRVIIYITADTNRRMDEVSGKLRTTMEYTKLLHTLSHNLVVELTKLKIEEEALKSKIRIMEKDFEMLEKREKTLEKKVFP